MRPREPELEQGPAAERELVQGGPERRKRLVVRHPPAPDHGELACGENHYNNWQLP